jgi:hypothetical protein
MLFLLMVNKLNKSTDQFHALQQSNQINKSKNSCHEKLDVYFYFVCFTYNMMKLIHYAS